MKTVLCYGDSNTWGYDPMSKERFAPETRWTGVLAESLGVAFRVIEEGLNGRTTVWDDPIEGHKNGQTYLVPCLASHKPIDLVVLMLGTNDLKMRFSVPADDIARGIGLLCDIILMSDTGRGGKPPQLILLAPPPLVHLTEFSEMFAGGAEKSEQLGERYGTVATEKGIEFLNAGEFIKTSDIDGVHFEADDHHHLGVAVALRVRRALG
jgi:lysophospholipase L1-like esterase